MLLTFLTGIFLVGAPHAFSAEYYVSSDGDKDPDGSIERPWGSIKYAESRLNPGDTVYIRGGTYDLPLSEHVVADVPNTKIMAYPGETPILDGHPAWPVWPPPRHPDNIDDLPPYNYVAMIRVNASNITIDGLHFRNAQHSAIQIEQDVGEIYHTGITVRNVKITDSYSTGLVIKRVSNVLIEDSTFEKGARAFYLWDQKIKKRDPAQVVTTRADHIIFRRNKVYHSYNEGVNIDHFTTNATVEFNEIYGNRKMQVYVISCDNITVRYNLIYGTNDSPTQTKLCPGIWINNERQWNKPEMSNIRIYGNVVANSSPSFWINGNEIRNINDVLTYNNTFIMPSGAQWGIYKQYGAGHQFINNIIWKIGGAGTISYIESRGITCDHNLWSTPPVDAAGGLNDPPNRAPLILQPSGWDDIKGGSLDGSEFALTSDSPAARKGLQLDKEYEMGIDLSNTEFPDSVSMARRHTYSWDIGADVFQSTGPNPPTLLRVIGGYQQ